MSVQNMQSFIQERANQDFPADELWRKGKNFVAIKRQAGKIIITKGTFKNSDIDYNTFEIVTSENRGENIIEKITKNMECFGMLGS